MTEIQNLQFLKNRILLEYQKHFPYFNGNWKTFSSQDIQNLILLIEETQKQGVSEKWIYTHLKPETNEKLPRKDMLDIFSKFCGYSGWEELIFNNANEPQTASKVSRKSKKLLWIIPIIAAITIGIFFVTRDEPQTQRIQLKNEFTDEQLKSDEIKVYKIDDSEKVPLKIKDDRVEVPVNSRQKTKIVVESPFYKKKQVDVEPTKSGESEILLKPDDYAMMLKAFMQSDIKEWQTRKKQLDKILSDDLEVILMLRDNLGAESLNKTEFSQKLIIPTTATRKMKIIEIKNDANNQIKFIRATQE